MLQLREEPTQSAGVDQRASQNYASFTLLVSLTHTRCFFLEDQGNWGYDVTLKSTLTWMHPCRNNWFSLWWAAGCIALENVCCHLHIRPCTSDDSTLNVSAQQLTCDCRWKCYLLFCFPVPFLILHLSCQSISIRKHLLHVYRYLLRASVQKDLVNLTPSVWNIFTKRSWIERTFRWLWEAFSRPSLHVVEVLVEIYRLSADQ